MSPLSGGMWDAVAPRLARDRRLIIPDRIGFGDSDRLAEPLPFPEYALATLDVLDALELDAVDVLGIHTGSCEAIELASVHPRRVRRIAVVSLPAMTDDERQSFKSTYSAMPEPVADGSHLQRYWRWWAEANPDGRWPAALVHERVLDHLRAGPHVWWTYHAVFDYPAGERAAAVRQPFTVFGPHDDLWRTTARAVADLPPHAQFVELPHLGYEIFTLAADEMAERVSAVFDAKEPV
jgi:pimeloyl-ACP methyl ester carboxylesterase